MFRHITKSSSAAGHTRRRHGNTSTCPYYPFRHITQQTFVLMKTSFVFVFRRRLDQDEYVRLSLTSSEDVFKTSWLRPIYSSYPYVFKTFSRRLAKTSSRRFENVFKTSLKRLQGLFKASSKRLQDIFNTFCKDIFQGIFKAYHQVSLF